MRAEYTPAQPGRTFRRGFPWTSRLPGAFCRIQSTRQGPSGSDTCEFYNRAGLCKTVRQPFRHETTLRHKPSRDARLLAEMSAGGKFKSDCDATLRFQELADDVGMTERWTHRGRNGPSSTRLLRWHIG